MPDIENKTNHTKTIGELIEIINKEETVIPLLQRNYKWTQEYASKLARDLWDQFIEDKEKGYNLSLVTIYKNENKNRLEIIDGQQRVITLRLLLRLLGQKGDKNLNFKFERDGIAAKRYNFIEEGCPEDKMGCSVDIKRLRNNYCAMMVPVCFEDFYDIYYYRKNIEKNKIDIQELEEKVQSRLSNLENKLSILENEEFREEIKKFLFDEKKEDKKKYIDELCEKFYDDKQKKSVVIHESSQANYFQDLLNEKLCLELKKFNSVAPSYIANDDFVDYIKNKVTVLYHETTSEPLDEFLNINENKTSFGISDYVRANMIFQCSENQNDSKATMERREILAQLQKLSCYLYSPEYREISALIRKKYPDIGGDSYTKENRLNAVFVDQYHIDSFRRFQYSKEKKRIEYLNWILDSLEKELEYDENRNIIGNATSYNIVDALLFCKKKHKFFNIFDDDAIEKKSGLNDVIAMHSKNFSFVEYAWNIMKDDPWNISYLLEALLNDKPNPSVKIENALKEKFDEKQWIYINHGEKHGKIENALKALIEAQKNETEKEEQNG